MKLKKLFFITSIIFAIAIFCGINANAATEVASGECGKNGDNITWVLDDEGLLTISGSGKMQDYTSRYVVTVGIVPETPWHLYIDDIEKVEFSGDITHIGDYSFYSCHIRGITIPETITSIGTASFSKSWISSITLPTYIKDISSNMFYDCNSLTSIIIPDGVTSIGNRAFYDCDNLTSIIIPSTVTSIGEDAFGACTKTKNVYITDIGSWCDISFSDESSSPMCSGSGNLIYLDNELITEVIIPEGKTVIKDYAFSGFDELTSITIPESVTSIGNYAFKGCDKLSSITIPESVTSIGEEAFSYCDNLTSITIPKSITTIESWMFHACGNLMTVIMPNSVTTIDDYAFNSCRKLNNIIIPESVTNMGDYIFGGCRSLENISIPDGVTNIGLNTFSNCSALSSVVIPISVTNIADNAFNNCSNLSKVYYYGDENEWAGITIGSNNASLTNLTPIFQRNYTFISNGGSEVELIKSFDGIAEEPQTSKDKFTFGGWYTNADLTGERVDFPYTNLADATFYAKWVCTVNYTGDYEVPSEVEIGSDAILPEPEYGYHYEFTLGGSAWDGKNITENVTVDVTKVRNTYAITYTGDYTTPDSVLFEGDVTLPVCPEYGWHYEFTSGGSAWDGKNITENVTVEVTKVRNTYAITYTGAYTTPDSVLFEGDVTLPVCLEYGWHYEFTLNNEPWDGKNIIDNVTVDVTKVRNTYTISYVGDYIDTDYALYEDDITLPTAPEGYVYKFTLNGNAWDGKNITKDISVSVTKQHDTSVLSVSNLESMEKDGFAISGIYYGQSYTPEASATNNATYKLYTDNECTNEVTAFTLARGINTAYIKLTCESGRSEVYTLSINRDVPESLGTLSLYQSSGANFTFKVTNTITGNPIVKVKYGYNSSNLSYEKTAVFDSATQTVYVEDLPENQYLYFKVVAIYDEIEAESTTIYEMTGENLSSECDVIRMISPIGGTIGEDTITDLKVSNKFDSIEIDVEVSPFARWELHEKRGSASLIEGNVLNLSEGNNRAFIWVYAEDNTVKKYQITVYRQTKSAAPVINANGGMANITMPNGESAKIIYTTDGTTPSETNGTEYTSPFGISEGQVIKAIAIDSSKDEISDISSYTVPVSYEIYMDISNAEILSDKCVFDIYIECPVASTIIVAVYDEENELIGLKSLSYDFADEVYEEYGFEVSYSGVPYSYKLMLWDYSNGVTPFTEAHSDIFK